MTGTDSNFIEVRTVRGDDAANDLLDEGWRIIGVYNWQVEVGGVDEVMRQGGDSGPITVFVMGRTE
jgi:Holliday junction resolvase-like predicted endonuclease